MVMNTPVNVPAPVSRGGDRNAMIAAICGESDHHQVLRRSCRYRPMQLLVLLALVSLSFAPGASAQAINRVFFFGDSLSDPGNHFIFTHASSRQPFLLGPPDASYDIGGHHFSDG
jgi:hypothetical protein